MKIIEESFNFKNKLTKRKKTTEIVLHCSATREGKDYTVQDIHKWHLKRGFSGIGYNYVIYRDGTIHEGRPEYAAGAHATNHNSISVGVCYIGGCDENNKAKDTRTVEQKEALYQLVEYLMNKYSITDKGILCHYQITVPRPNMKACPSFKREQFIDEFTKYRLSKLTNIDNE